MTERTLMILGAGRGQVPLIEAATARGFRTVVASTTHRAYPGLVLADEVVEVDIRDREAVAAAAREHGVDGIATACADTGIASLGYAVEALGLVGLSADAASLCNDKLAMKARLIERGVPTAAYRIVEVPADVDEFIGAHGLPVVVKAPDLQGSQGVTIARTRDEAVAALENARELSFSSRVLVEEFLDGVELGAQAMVSGGRVSFVLVHDDQMFDGAVPVPMGHSIPTDLPPAAVEACDAAVRQAISAIGLDDCAVNVDLMIVDGDPFIIELTGRAGANGLCEIVSHGFGVDYPGIIADLAMGDRSTQTALTPEGGAPAVLSTMVTPPGATGTIPPEGIAPVVAPEGTECSVFPAPGETVGAFESSNDYVGQVIAWGGSLAEARTRADKAADAIRDAVLEAL